VHEPHLSPPLHPSPASASNVDGTKGSTPINEIADQMVLNWASPEASRFAAMFDRSYGEPSLLFVELLCYPSLRTLIEPHVRPNEAVLMVDIATQGRLEQGAITVSSNLVINQAGRHGRLGNITTSITGSASAVETSRRFLLRSMSAPAPSPRGRSHRRNSSVDGALAEMFVPVGAASKFAEISNDTNPIHTDPAAATLAGFSAPSVHGIYLLARAVCCVADKLDWSMAEIDRVSCRFGLPVSEGTSIYVTHVEHVGADEVKFSVEITEGTALRRVALRRASGVTG
jgi:acyl dehydratase